MKILQTVPLDKISDPVMAMAVFMQNTLGLEILQITEDEVHLGNSLKKQHMYTLKSSFHNQVLFVWIHHYRPEFDQESYLDTAINLGDFTEALRSNTLIQFIQQQTQLQFHEYSDALKRITETVLVYLAYPNAHQYITRRTLLSLVMAIHYESHSDFLPRLTELIEQDVIDLYEGKLYFKYHIVDMKSVVDLFEQQQVPGPLRDLYVLFDLHH